MGDDENTSLISQLEELRKTLLKCIVSIILVFPFALWFSPKILNRFIKILIGKNNITLNFFSPIEVFMVQIKLALLVSAVVAFPYIAKKLWDYVVPALYEKERKIISKLIFTSIFLFFAGCIFCLFMILPLIINFGISFANDNINALFGITNIINLSFGLIFVFGLMFQIPLVVNFLIKFDIISRCKIASCRPYVAVVLLVICALLTPPDVISQILLFTPVYGLFELGLLFSKRKKGL